MTHTVISIIFYLGWTGLAGCHHAVPVPQDELFNQDWKFYRSSDTAVFPPFSAEWVQVVLPHTAHLEPLTVTHQWQGICFYKKSFSTGRSLENKSISLQFDGAMNVADVWVNGKKMIHHLGGYLPFVIRLDSVLRFDTLNTVLVRLDNRDNPITGPKPLKILDFNMYGGLYRDVHLIVKDRIHISNSVQANAIAGGGVFYATTSASPEQSGFVIKTQVQNETGSAVRISMVQQLYDAHGKLVVSLKLDSAMVSGQGSTELTQTGTIAHPNLWSPSTPYLYTLQTNLYVNGQLTDNQSTRVGICSIRISPEGIWLNGEKTFLTGVNRHQEYPYVGYALSDADQYRDAYRIKQAGFDFVRCSHYPVSPAFLDACDELGIMVLDAILGWQYFGGEEFERLALQSGRELIRRDRNHPCVLAWELSINETDMPRSFTDSANNIVHEEFPYSSCYSAGWMRQSYNIYIEARQHRKGLYPEKPLLVSEYGDWEYFAQNAGFRQEDWKNLLPEERNSRQPRFSGEKRMLQQALNIQEAHNDNLSTPAFADAYWVMFDYNRGMAHEQEYSGVMDIFRLPKFSYYFFKSQRSYSARDTFSTPMVYIASYWQPRVSKNVRVFSNCQEVELFVDGKSAGRQKPDQNKMSINLNHPPFTFHVTCEKPEILKAIGYIDGKAAAEYILRTAGAPDRLSLMTDICGKATGKNDLIFIYARILDRNNTLVLQDSSEVSFKVEGASITGPSTIKAQAGIGTILIRTSPEPSWIRISATSRGIKADSLSIHIQ